MAAELEPPRIRSLLPSRGVLLLSVIGVTVGSALPTAVAEDLAQAYWFAGGFERGVGNVTYSPDGALLAGNGGSIVKVWRVADGVLLHNFHAFNDDALRIAFSPNGKYLGSVGYGDMMIWRLRDERLVLHLTGLNLRGIAFSSNGKLFAAGTGDRLTGVWRTRNGELVRILDTSSTGADMVAFSRDGRWLAVGGHTRHQATYTAHISLWRKGSWEQQSTWVAHPDAPMTSIAFSPDSTLIASCGRDDIAVCWSIPDGQHRQTFRGHFDDVASLVFTPDGQRLITGGEFDGDIRIWNVRDGTTLMTIHEGRTVRSVAVSPIDASFAVGADYYEGQRRSILRIRALSDGHEESLIGPVRSTLTCVKVSPRGRIVAAGSIDHRVLLCDAVSGQVLKVLECAGSVFDIGFTPDGRYLVAGEGAHLGVWDMDTFELVNRWEVYGSYGYVSHLVVLSDGEHVVNSLNVGGVQLWKLPDGGLIRAWYDARAGGLDASLERDLLVTLDTSPNHRYVTLWSLSTGDFKREFYFHDVGPRLVRLTPDGSAMAIAASRQVLVLWDATDGHQIQRYRGFDADVAAVAFSEDGKVLTASTSRAYGVPPRLYAWNLEGERLDRSDADWGDVPIGLEYMSDGCDLLVGFATATMARVKGRTGRP